MTEACSVTESHFKCDWPASSNGAASSLSASYPFIAFRIQFTFDYSWLMKIRGLSLYSTVLLFNILSLV